MKFLVIDSYKVTQLPFQVCGHHCTIETLETAETSHKQTHKVFAANQVSQISHYIITNTQQTPPTAAASYLCVFVPELSELLR